MTLCEAAPDGGGGAACLLQGRVQTRYLPPHTGHHTPPSSSGNILQQGMVRAGEWYTW